ncbi:hypothetical protein [Rossellomorea vietnamensis]|uniref:hypothetical protein n=1 Tax=Rossellomorea vietnamensis TaxID=218284 RepID=UPI001E444AA7|nr:hypothetical protein [Rossellomorea vietnamensis]MCC5803618.1 hypothetical protein [Rossellomorea vietnamensis]
MKKALGIVLMLGWITLFFYYFNMIMPKNILYWLVALPAVYFSSVFVLRKSGIEI